MIPVPQDASLENAERAHIIRVLRLTKNNKRQAAKLLRISRGTLYRRLKLYGLAQLIREPQRELDELGP